MTRQQLQACTKEMLCAMARRRGLAGGQAMSKDQLVRALLRCETGRARAAHLPASRRKAAGATPEAGVRKSGKNGHGSAHQRRKALPAPGNGAASPSRELRGDRPRDRLFDVLMRRFDALKPHRAGLAAVAKEMGGIGVGDAICGAQRMMRSLAWMLEAAGIGSGGMAGSLRVKGLAVVYAATFSTWLKDDSEDMAKTMAALDKNLDRAERWTNFFGRKGKAAEPEAEPA